MPECPICSSDAIRESLSVYDDRYGYPGEFRLLECTRCGHVTLDHLDLSPAEVTRIYSDYYPRASIDLDNLQPHAATRSWTAWLEGDRSRAFRWVPENVDVLDIGCGMGQALAYFEQHGCRAYGVDPDENARRAAERFGYRITVGLFRGDMFPPASFDYVTLDQVIEHFRHPLSLLTDVATLLRPGGHCVISTPNARGWGRWLFGQRWINWHAPYHMNLFSRKSIALTAARCGFVLESAQTITPSEWLHLQWCHLVLYPRSGHKSMLWSPHGRMRTSARRLLGALRRLHAAKLDHLLTRAFDAVGLGDNLVCLLRKR